jgi:hypothetical protein
MGLEVLEVCRRRCHAGRTERTGGERGDVSAGGDLSQRLQEELGARDWQGRLQGGHAGADRRQSNRTRDAASRTGGGKRGRYRSRRPGRRPGRWVCGRCVVRPLLQSHRHLQQFAGSRCVSRTIDRRSDGMDRIRFLGWGGVAGGGASLLGSLLPKAPPKPSKLPQKTPIEPGPSLSEGMPPAIKVINADMRTGDVTISVRDLESGEMFMAEGNVHTGNATVTNMSTGEVVGYVREDTFAAAPEGAFSTGESSMAEAGVTSLAETDLPAAAQAPPMPKELRPGQGPPTAFARGTAPRTPAEVTKFLRDAGLEESEIISFGGEHARHLGSRSAGRVAQLAERFTAADLKALGEFLWEHEIVIDDELTEMFIDRIETGQMAERLATIESRAEIALMTGTKFDLLNEIRLGVVEPRAPRLPAVTPEMTWPKLDPAWEMAQKQAGPAIEKKFGAGAEPQSREIAPGARPGESLGSTVPEYVYRAQGEIIRAFEVKRLRLDEMGIGPMGQRIGPPSEATVEAIIRARAQLGGRRWVLPPGCEQHIIFNVTGQGVTDVVAVGKQIKAALLEGFITYDHVWVQVGYELTEIN